VTQWSVIMIFKQSWLMVSDMMNRCAADEIQIELLTRKWLPVIPFETQQKVTCLQTQPDSETMAFFLTILRCTRSCSQVSRLMYKSLCVRGLAHRWAGWCPNQCVYEGLLEGGQADVDTYRSFINRGTNSLECSCAATATCVRLARPGAAATSQGRGKQGGRGRREKWQGGQERNKLHPPE